MRNLRLLAVSAVLATGALAAATVPAFATTTAHPSVTAATDDPTPPVATTGTTPNTTGTPGPAATYATVTISGQSYTATCVLDGGTYYYVNADGISIRNPAGGSAVEGIQQNRWWVDEWNVGSFSGTYTCTSFNEVNNQFWMPGFANYNGQLGWIGADYLNYLKHFS